MLQGKQAAIFDLDGTLVDSMWMWPDIDIEYLARFGLPVPDTLQVEIEGMGFTETALYFKKRFGIPHTPEEIKDDWNRMAYDKYAREVPLKPGALELLSRLKGEGVKLGIATSNRRELALAALKNNHVEEFFDCLLTSCDVAKGKPSPDVYLSAADTMGVSPASCLVFEDVPMGILAGKNAGMSVCAIEDASAANRVREIRSLADYYIHDFFDVLNGTFEVLS